MNARLVLVLSFAITSCAQIGSAQSLDPAYKAESDTLKVPPIVYPETARTSRDVQEQQRVWAERMMMLEPFKAQLAADQPRSEEALAFVEEAVAEWARDPAVEAGDVDDSGAVTVEGPPVLLAKRGAQLVKGGCNDPLVLFLTNHFRRKTGDNSGLATAAFKAFTDLDAGDASPIALTRLAGLNADLILKTQNKTQMLAEVDKRLPDLAREAFEAGD